MQANNTETAIGIDLGTTYCCVAVFQNGITEVIANDQGNRITPSTVAFTKDERLVGEGADIQKRLQPENAIFNSKRFIGRDFDDLIVQLFGVMQCSLGVFGSKIKGKQSKFSCHNILS